MPARRRCRRTEKRTGTSRAGRANSTPCCSSCTRATPWRSPASTGWPAPKAKGVTLKATEQPADTATAAGKAFFDMLGVFTEFATNLRRNPRGETPGSKVLDPPPAKASARILWLPRAARRCALPGPTLRC